MISKKKKSERTQFKPPSKKIHLNGFPLLKKIKITGELSKLDPLKMF